MESNIFERLAKLSHLVEIVHHIPGRIRLKFKASILKELGEGGVDELEQIQSRMSGIREVKVNKMARSATIAYDTTQIPMAFFEQLAEGVMTPEMESCWNKEAE